MINSSTWATLEATLPDLIPKLVENLAIEGQAYVDHIVAAAQEGDWQEVIQNAHPLKSMAMHLGADDLSEIAATLEDDPEGAPDLVDTLTRRFEAARDAAQMRVH